MTLSWYRSWPAPEEWAAHDLDKVPHVVDQLPRLTMSAKNYQRVQWPKDLPGFCMLEWDIALDSLSRRRFITKALERPHEVLVAPYLFHDTVVCWVGNDGSHNSADDRPLRGGCEHCGEDRTDSFGFGCIYFPQDVLREFLAQMDHTGMTDDTFGQWYLPRYGQARVTWSVHPQHLHDYEVEDARARQPY